VPASPTRLLNTIFEISTCRKHPGSEKKATANLQENISLSCVMEKFIRTSCPKPGKNAHSVVIT